MWLHTDCTSTGSVSAEVGPPILSVSMELGPDPFTRTVVVGSRLGGEGADIGRNRPHHAHPREQSQFNLNKHWFNHYAPGTVPRAGDTEMSRRGKGPAWQYTHSSRGDRH